MDCALDLMRRLPPQQIEKNLSDLIDLVPSLCEDLLSSVDQPLKIAKDKESGKDYLLCDYNRDGDSYRFVQIKIFRQWRFKEWVEVSMRCFWDTAMKETKFAGRRNVKFWIFQKNGICDWSVAKFKFSGKQFFIIVDKI